MEGWEFLQAWWIDVCEQAIVQDLQDHNLRHTALSCLIDAGVDYAGLSGWRE
jgi:hypothetical protein